MKFKTQIFTHFDRCDLAGIVFYGNYAALAHQVLEQFIPHMGIPWQTWFQNPTWAMPIRKLDVEYFKPLFAGQNYQAEAAVVKIGDSSLTFSVEFLDSQGELCTRIQTVHVCVALKDKKKAALPPEFRKQLNSWLLKKSSAE